MDSHERGEDGFIIRSAKTLKRLAIGCLIYVGIPLATLIVLSLVPPQVYNGSSYFWSVVGGVTILIGYVLLCFYDPNKPPDPPIDDEMRAK